MSIQNIMNVCFAICITFLIFQNQQLKDQADTLKGFAQLDVEKSFDRLDEMELRIDKHETQLGYQAENLNNTNEGGNLVLDEIERLDENITILDANTGTLQENQQQLRKAVGNIEKYLVELTAK
jgi:hypothetical protein